jgi:Squalene-hopene cyclase C-terminal domain
MRNLFVALALSSVLFIPGTPLAAADKGPTAEQIRAAVRRSLPLLQKGAEGHRAQRTCFACHNQALPLLALSTAKTRGFTVDDAEVKKQLQHIADFLGRNRENYQKGRGQGGQADTAGYALLALDVGGWKGDKTTAAVAEYLLLRDKDSDHWRTNARRPPSEASPFTTTYVAVRGIQTFGTAAQKERITARVEKVRNWLRKTRARETEDRVFRLYALARTGASEKERKAAVQDLLDTQRKDGGWAQLDGHDSDAYATGSALVALHQAGGLPVTDPAYQRGLRFLVDTQEKDGSWKVKSRSRPFQTYYESGFPHGKDQFISSAASGWATTALALACAPKEGEKSSKAGKP